MITDENQIKEVFDDALADAKHNILELRKMFPSVTIEGIAFYISINAIEGGDHGDDVDKIDFDGTYQFNLTNYRLAESQMYLDSLEQHTLQ
ncbi:hypothetical protein P3911_004473 [Salmonella enterica]|nr:hypothetical protein [Salmonella enterica]